VVVRAGGSAAGSAPPATPARRPSRRHDSAHRRSMSARSSVARWATPCTSLGAGAARTGRTTRRRGRRLICCGHALFSVFSIHWFFYGYCAA
jgi:hypothetical protein